MYLMEEGIKSFEELDKRAELDEGLLKELKEKNNQTIFKSVQNLMGRAESAMKKKDIGGAFIFYSRAGKLCTLIRQSKEKDKFARTVEGQKFIQFFKMIIENINKLEGELKRYFQEMRDRQLAVEMDKVNVENEIIIPIKVEQQQPVKPKVIEEEPFGDVITPKQLVDYAKTGRRILIIDYRDKTNVQINFNNHHDGANIVVALCPPQFIEGNITLAHLSKVVPIKERQKVDKYEMEKYDLVVFMDGEDPRRDMSNELLPPANHLMKGLTIYAYNNRLKRKPVFMKGGFKMWQYSYSMYTNQEFNQSLFMDDDEEFGKMLSEFRKPFEVIDMKYPDLVRPRTPEPPWPSSTGGEMMQQQQQPVYNNDVKFRKLPLAPNPSTNPFASTNGSTALPSNHLESIPNGMPLQPIVNNVPPSRPETSFSVAPNVPPIQRLQQPPQFDRSNKPMAPPRTLPPNMPPPQLPAQQYSMPPTKVNTQKLLQLYESAFQHLRQKSQYNNQPGVGFRNLGNTCFMNTTLQAIINTPRIRSCFTRDAFMKYVNEKNKFGTNGTISAVFSALVDLYFSGEVTVITPEIFLKTFASEVNSQLADKRQHDAQEFQIYLMDALHEDTNRVQVRKPFEQDYNGKDMAKHAKDYDSKLSQFASSPIADLFNLRTVSVVTCSVCNTSSATFEDQAQISLELEDNTFVRLDDCLKRHFKKELLNNDSRWNCPSCKRPQVATRQTKIWKMPKTLVIHFKRFSQYDGGYVKNDTNVHFEIDALRIDQYLHEEAPRQNSYFSLYAVTNHTGTLNSGHYTSYVKSKHRWLKFDDDFVSEVSRELLQSNKAFVLFYTTHG